MRQPAATASVPTVGEAELSCPSVSGLRDRFRVVVRYPVGSPCSSVVVFCHGVGEHADHYARLARHWAASGLLVLQPEFADSWPEVAAAEPSLGLDPAERSLRWLDDPEIRPVFRSRLFDPVCWWARLLDCTSVLDNIGVLAERAGLSLAGAAPRVAVAGHSFGAFTAQILLGAAVDIPGRSARVHGDERISAGLFLSPQGSGERGLTKSSWEAMVRPVMVITGTADTDAAGHALAWRREPYDRSPASNKHLVVLDGADHGLGGVAGSGRGFFKDDERALAAIDGLSTLFLRSTLGGEGTARSLLDSSDGSELGCLVEHR